MYVKADVRAPYQEVLAVLNALHGKSVVLLSAPPEVTPRQGYAQARIRAFIRDEADRAAVSL